MKYEISQAGYRDFLNTLDSQQQSTRTSTAPNSARGSGAFTSYLSANGNFLRIDTPATSSTAAVYDCNENNNSVYNESGDGEWEACNYLAWTDVAAYLDWSGFAPMSEIQYERMCRGTSSAGANPSILGEYTWGDSTIAAYSYTITGVGTPSELVSNASTTLGNAAFSTTSTYPLRNGIFATSTSNRTTSGATFYGIMEMSGNVYEDCICLGDVAGRSCKYVPDGDGNLSPIGNANLSAISGGFWPGMEGNSNISMANTCVGTCEVTGAAGIRYRGGSVSNGNTTLRISDRSLIYTPTARYYDRGGRGVLYIR